MRGKSASVVMYFILIIIVSASSKASLLTALKKILFDFFKPHQEVIPVSAEM